MYGDEAEDLRAEVNALRKKALERLERVSAKAEDALSHMPASLENKGRGGAAATLEEEKRFLGLDGDQRRGGVKKKHTNNKTTEANTTGRGGENVVVEGRKENVGKRIDLSTAVQTGDGPLEGTYWKVMLNIGREPGEYCSLTQ